MNLLTSLSTSLNFTLVFSLAVVFGLLTQLWLTHRQSRHVALNRAAVPNVFAQKISLAAHQKAADYTLAKSRFSVIQLVLSTSVLIGWTLMGGLHALNTALIDAMGFGMDQQVALILSFIFINALIDMPLGWYQTFVLEQRFGFNKMTTGLWLIDMAKSTLVGALIGLPLLWAVLWLMGSSGNLWWLWAWALWTTFTLAMMVIYPTWIAPLFNQFKPLEDAALQSRVTDLMQRCGFSAKGLFVMDGSKRSAHANAYFTGLGASKRVVFYDTLLKQLSPSEVEAVLAHELGHFKKRHIAKRMVSIFTISLIALAFLGWLSTQIWFYTGLGVLPNIALSADNPAAPNDALALILFMLVVPIFGFFVSPVSAQLSRQHEFEADAYAMEHTQGGQLASALLKLYEDNASTLTPDPLFARFYYSHPPASERLARMPQPV